MIARITPAPAVVDGVIDEAWRRARPASLTHPYSAEQTAPASSVFEYPGADDKLALDIYTGGGGNLLKLPQRHNFGRFPDQVFFGVPLASNPPPGAATNTPTHVQLRRNPYHEIHDTYYGGLGKKLPWLRKAP